MYTSKDYWPLYAINNNNIKNNNNGHGRNTMLCKDNWNTMHLHVIILSKLRWLRCHEAWKTRFQLQVNLKTRIVMPLVAPETNGRLLRVTSDKHSYELDSNTLSGGLLCNAWATVRLEQLSIIKKQQRKIRQ